MVGHEKYKLDSLICSSPRKSLVKGERFIRCEEKPEMKSERDLEKYFNELTRTRLRRTNTNMPYAGLLSGGKAFLY